MNGKGASYNSGDKKNARVAAPCRFQDGIRFDDAQEVNHGGGR
jgi:hypothetical protein